MGWTIIMFGRAFPAMATIVLGISAPASADILSSTTFPLDASGSSRAALPLNGASATSNSFSVPGTVNKKIAVTYSATCAAGGSASGFVDIDIVVDGKEISPTDTSGEVFCQGDATAGADTFSRATIIGIKSLKPGQHTVEVYAEPLGGATSFQIGAATLLIQD
jgi:hypothetical protein